MQRGSSKSILNVRIASPAARMIYVYRKALHLQAQVQRLTHGVHGANSASHINAVEDVDFEDQPRQHAGAYMVVKSSLPDTLAEDAGTCHVDS